MLSPDSGEVREIPSHERKMSQGLSMSGTFVAEGLDTPRNRARPSRKGGLPS